MQFRRRRILVSLTHERLTLTMHPEGANRPFQLSVGDEVREMRPGDHTEFELGPRPPITQ